MVKLKRKINLAKGLRKIKRIRIKIDIKKFMIEWWSWKEYNIFFPKGPRKKLEIKIMRTKSKNLISSIWIEWWNLKQIIFLQEGQR